MGRGVHIEWESEEEWRMLLIRRKRDSFHMCIFWLAWRKGRSLEFLMLEAFLWQGGVHPR
jgi:hypothetical protein